VGVAEAWLANGNFVSASDNYIGLVVSSAAENTVDAKGQVKYRWQSFQTYPSGSSSVLQTWGGAPYARREADLHWNGSSWKVCGINSVNQRSAPDANGNISFNYCDGLHTGTSMANAVDISGKKLQDVYQAIRGQGYTNLTVSNPGQFGSAAFPAGSKLAYFSFSGAIDSHAPAYYPGSDNWVYLPDAKLATGDATACAANPTPNANPNATLDQLLATLRGTPCVGTQNMPTGKGGVKLDSGTKNEGWGSTTLGLTTLGNAPTFSQITDASSFYTGNTPLRVAFAAGNVAKYYACQQRWDGRVRNCTSIGMGAYTQETLGDAKLLRLSGLPAAFTNGQRWEPVFVQRGSHVYYGYQDLPYPGRAARLNLVATQAMLAAQGLSTTLNPDSLVKLTPQSYAGTYSGSITGTGGAAVGMTGNFSSTLSPGQAAFCPATFAGLVSTSNPTGAFSCTNLSVVPHTADRTLADFSFGTSTNANTLFTGMVDFYTGVLSGTWSGSDNSASFSGTFNGLRE
jgi:hypothetical protein